MSSWFEGYLAFDLSPDAPKEVIDAVAYLTRSEDHEFESPPDHEYFTIPGWRNFLQVETTASGQPGLFWSDFRQILRSTHKGRDIHRHTLSFRRLMHDDTEFYQLWWYFIDWIAPYAETTGYVGYYRQTYALHPKIIYLKDGKVFRVKISANPEGWHGELWDGDPKYVLPGWMRSE